jgi:prepilin-type N-terminal cleavage/methylation domain-containing protein
MRLSTFAKRSRGYSLLELMVAMLAGLIVAAGVVGLSRIATNTFHEESRLTASEMALRTGADRLRADLSRAAFMSSPNIQFDPLRTTPASFAGAPVDPAAVSTYEKGIVRLSGFDYTANGSYSEPGASKLLKLSDVNNVAPDALVVGGNLTTADEYIVQSVTFGDGDCAGGTVTLSTDSAATLRLTHAADGSAKTDPDATRAVAAAFQPVAAERFLARLVDETGHSQYLVLCDRGHASVGGVVRISLDSATPIARASQTSTVGGLTGFGVGRFTLNPIQMVRWAIEEDALLAVAGVAPGGGAPDPVKFNLTRTWLNARGQRVGRPELVAEFAVDLEFSFSVNNPAGATPGARQIAFDYGNTGNSTWATAPGSTTVGPQFIRSVSFRLAIRGSAADRTDNIPPDNPGYLYRYCVDENGCDTSRTFTRVRTLITEVQLPNQIRQF